MTTTTFLLLLCAVLCVFGIYNYMRRKDVDELRIVAEDNYAEIASEKVELESKLLKSCKEIDGLNAKLKLAESQADKIGVVRAKDGTFRSYDAVEITPRKPKKITLKPKVTAPKFENGDVVRYTKQAPSEAGLFDVYVNDLIGTYDNGTIYPINDEPSFPLIGVCDLTDCFEKVV